MQRLRRRLDNDRGTSAVEFAIVLPVFLLLVFGGLTFGLGLSAKAVFNEAAAGGARAAVGPYQAAYSAAITNGQSPSQAQAAGEAAAGTYAQQQAQNVVNGAGSIYSRSFTVPTPTFAQCASNQGTLCITVSVSGAPPINI